jgi:hypothetical protein
MIVCGPSSRECKVRQPDIPFSNAYHVSNDHHKQITPRSYPALSPRYAAVYPREHGCAVDFFDSAFQANEDALPTNVRLLKPCFAGISTLVIGRATTREQIRALTELGCTMIAGGPIPQSGRESTSPSAEPRCNRRPWFLP